jgi:tRNA G10  N-methylase Trm11
MIPDVRMVGIEIANDQLVNREDIMRDFQVRNLNPPLALIQGDSTVDTIRDDARSFIGGEPFDLIITDPPYGIRESNSHNQGDPIFELCGAMAKDLQDGKPLLKSGGKLVAFIPCCSSTRIEDCIPPKNMLNEAGLEVGDMIEQTLNENLSRWLVTFHAVNC